VLEWSQTVDNLNDTTWENPYDVSKGHRGFIDGDFVMMMYATAANWKANTTGNEAYQLYIRRSFDGGQTWTTLPADYTHWSDLNPDVTVTADGTETCEWYGGYTEDDYSVCTPYGAGEFEPGRNVSQLTGTKVTVLDPRYSPSGGMLKRDYASLLCDPELDGIWENCGLTEATYPEDTRDPSAFFATFETGDNTVVTVDTATVPLDMYYSRASNFGDDWDEQDICATDPEESWYPNASVVCEEGDTEWRWDWLENGPDLATEASVFGNPNGDRFYAVWNQELEIAYEVYTDMDSQFRRIFYNLFTDATPTASILSASASILSVADNDVLTVVGSGRDHDSQGVGPQIQAYDWFDDTGAIRCDPEVTGEPCKDKDKDGVCDKCDDENHNMICDNEEILTCERVTEIKAGDLARGHRKIHLRVKDNDGHWSHADEIEVWVFDKVFRTYLPFAMK
jgi:hypothetical protein